MYDYNDKTNCEKSFAIKYALNILNGKWKLQIMWEISKLGTVRFNETAGSMAKDSVFNAASVIRKITDKDIKEYDIHVNVIGGGQIDGPSAGAAITICIISALLNRKIRQDVAITGEISLRGKVKPVGGIFEKIYGARRKGIKLVLVPKDNEKEIPLGLNDIEVRAVSDIEELMEIVFE